MVPLPLLKETYTPINATAPPLYSMMFAGTISSTRPVRKTMLEKVKSARVPGSGRLAVVAEVGADGRDKEGVDVAIYKVSDPQA